MFYAFLGNDRSQLQKISVKLDLFLFFFVITLKLNIYKGMSKTKNLSIFFKDKVWFFVLYFFLVFVCLFDVACVESQYFSIDSLYLLTFFYLKKKKNKKKLNHQPKKN